MPQTWITNDPHRQWEKVSGPTQTVMRQTCYSLAHLKNLEPIPPNHDRTARDFQINDRVRLWALNLRPAVNTWQTSWGVSQKENHRDMSGNILQPPHVMWREGRGGVGVQALPRRGTLLLTCLFVRVAIRCTPHRKIWTSTNHSAMAELMKTTRDPGDSQKIRSWTKSVFLLGWKE